MNNSRKISKRDVVFALLRLIANSNCGKWVINRIKSNHPVGGLIFNILAVNIQSALGYVKVSVIGMPKSGKTTWCNFLQGKSLVKNVTTIGVVSLPDFVANLIGNSKTIIKLSDVGGSEAYVSDYKKLMLDSGMVFFFFNAYKYLNSIEYQREVNSRLEYVNYLWEEYKNINMQLQVFLIMTYGDKLLDRKNSYEDILKILSYKSYHQILENNVVVDMTSIAELKEFREKMFGKSHPY